MISAELTDDIIFDETETSDMKRRLENIETYLPDEQKVVYIFAHYFGRMLDPRTNPLSFAVTYYNILFRVAMTPFSKSIARSRQVPFTLFERERSEYAELAEALVRIADAACLEDFAGKVRQVYHVLHDGD